LLGLSKENPIHTLPLQSLNLQTLRLVSLAVWLSLPSL
jgi:hypothetical protein